MDIRLVSADVAWIAEDRLCVPCTVAELAALLHVTPATVRRWCRARCVPELVRARLRSGVLGLFEHKRWEGWSVDQKDGRLWSPAGMSFMPPEVENMGIVRQLNDALRAELTEARAELDQVNGGRVFCGVLPSRHRRPSRAGNPSSTGR